MAHRYTYRSLLSKISTRGKFFNMLFTEAIIIRRLNGYGPKPWMKRQKEKENIINKWLWNIERTNERTKKEPQLTVDEQAAWGIKEKKKMFPCQFSNEQNIHWMCIRIMILRTPKTQKVCSLVYLYYLEFHFFFIYSCVSFVATKRNGRRKEKHYLKWKKE